MESFFSVPEPYVNASYTFIMALKSMDEDVDIIHVLRRTKFQNDGLACLRANQEQFVEG